MEQKKRKIRILPIVLVLVVVAIAAFLIPQAAEFMRNSSRSGEDVTVTIKQGANISEIADVLKENGIIKYKNVFLLRVKLDGKASALNYGTFVLNTGMCISDIIDVLENTKYKKETVQLTVPEGFSAEQIAERAESIGLCSKEEFLTALKDEYDYSFIAQIPEKDGVKYRLQGFLFPKTYEFAKDASAHDIVNTMLGQFEAEFREITEKNGVSLYDAVTMASLIEREAKLDSERPIIAGVMYNRLEANMKLQIDATVVYAISDGLYNVTRVTYDDLRKDSPYNTYKVSGLPVGPIANPGLKSLKAAYAPNNHKYYYYHTDTEKNDGSHIFTETYDEHLGTMN